MPLKFLITGCHGDLAFSIASIIKKNFKNAILIGSDITSHGTGNAIFDKIYKVPKSNSHKYFKVISKISRSANLIIPSTDNEIYFFSKKRKNFKNKILINNQNIIDLFSDKFRTQKFLKKNFIDLSLKFSIKLSDYLNSKKIPPPFFLKKISGSGNQNYKMIENKDDLNKLKFLKKNKWVIEEPLRVNLDEFTCTIIRLNKLREIIIFKRKLHKLGHTMFVEKYENPIIKKKLLNLAENLNLNGSLNVQFKIQNGKIKIFDINPRLSSTVKMRDMIGFKDCLWWINDKLNIKNKQIIKIKKFKYIVKHFQEKIIK